MVIQDLETIRIFVHKELNHTKRKIMALRICVFNDSSHLEWRLACMVER